MRYLWFWILVVLFILVVLTDLFGNAFYVVAIKRREDVPDKPEKHPEKMSVAKKEKWNMRYKIMDFIERTPYTMVHTKSVDGFTLAAYSFRQEKPCDVTVICVHGHCGRPEYDCTIAPYFYEHSHINVLMPYNRAHRKSEGKHIGFGWYDRLDILKWIDYLIETNGKDHKIVLWGVSMGAAAVMMASGEPLPPNVKFAVEDCGFSDMKRVVTFQIWGMLHGIPPYWVVFGGNIITRIKAGYAFRQVVPKRDIQRATIPFLFIHGTADTKVPTKMIHEVYDACRAPKKKLLVPGADHIMSYTYAPEEYGALIDEYMQRYVYEGAKDGIPR